MLIIYILNRKNNKKKSVGNNERTGRTALYILYRYIHIQTHIHMYAYIHTYIHTYLQIPTYGQSMWEK